MATTPPIATVTPTTVVIPTATVTATGTTAVVALSLCSDCRPASASDGAAFRDLAYTGGAQHTAPAANGQLQFDGDQASASFTVTAPAPPPFTVTQAATCTGTPTVGVPDSCTIIETVANHGNHTLDFSRTVTNHISKDVGPIKVSAAVGSVTVSGTTVVWNGFQLSPGVSASASIQVSFTPSPAQVGAQITLSDGITADAVDVLTGQRYVVMYGTLKVPARVMARSAPATRTSSPRAAGAPTSSRGSSPAPAGVPTVTVLPKSGGGGDEPNVSEVRLISARRISLIHVQVARKSMRSS